MAAVRNTGNIDNSQAEISRMRRNFDNTIEDMKVQQQMELDKVRINSDEKSTKEKNNYDEAKAKLENEFNERIDSIRRGTAEKIDQQRENYLSLLRKEKVNVEKEQNDDKIEMNRRLKDIVDSFRRSNEREREEHTAIQGNTNKNYGKRLQTMTDQNQKDLDIMLERSKITEANTARKRALEKDALFKDHQVEMQEQKKLETKRRLEQVGAKEEELKTQKDFYKNENYNLVRSQQNTMDSIKKKNEENLINMQGKFDNVTNTLREKALVEEENSRRDSFRRLREIEQQNEKEKNFLNRKISDITRANDSQRMMKDDGGGGGDKSNGNLDGFKNNLEKIKTDYNAKNDKVRQSYLDEVGDIKQKIEAKQTKALADLSDYSAKQNARSQKERVEVEKFYKAQNSQTQGNFEKMLDQQKKFSDNRMKDQVQSFNQKVQDINTRSYETLEQVRNRYFETHREALGKKDSEHSEVMDQMKRDFSDRMYEVQKVMQERLKLKDSELRNVVERYETTIKAMEEAKIKDDRYREFLYQEKRKEDMDVLATNAEKKQAQTKLRIDEMRNHFETKIDEIQKEHARAIKQLVNLQKEQITALQAEKFHELKKIDKHAKSEIDKAKVQAQDEINRISTTYESRILQLKDNIEGLKYKNSTGKDL